MIKQNVRDSVEKLSKEFQEGTPFPHCVIPEILEPAFVEELKKDLLQETFFEKSNDLYDFSQTDDLKLSTKPTIVKLRETLYGKEFLSFMEGITGMQLEPTPDMAGLCFEQHGNLLCHDDELEGRRIAYILYLVEDWKEEDGGHLDVFSTDEDGEPNHIVKSLLPKENSLAFFEVRPDSFHQVREVLTKKRRLSISGWFHGKSPYTREEKKKKEGTKNPLHKEEVSLSTWIQPSYLEKDNHTQIQEIFLEQSSIELQHFLVEEKYEQVIRALESTQWKEVGPAIRRTYSVAENTGILQELHTLLQSAAFGTLLEQLTGLEPHTVFGETRRFQAGDYTLLHDEHIQQPGLDLCLSFTQEWEASWGGITHYMSEQEVLLSLPPKPNTLSLVYRDEGAHSFVKYVHSGAKKKRYDISLTYEEN